MHLFVKSLLCSPGTVPLLDEHPAVAVLWHKACATIHNGVSTWQIQQADHIWMHA